MFQVSSFVKNYSILSITVPASSGAYTSLRSLIEARLTALSVVFPDSVIFRADLTPAANINIQDRTTGDAVGSALNVTKSLPVVGILDQISLKAAADATCLCVVELYWEPR